MTQKDYGLNISRVALRVNDLDKVTAFYKTTVGLSVLQKDDDLAVLGAGGSPLLELHHDSEATYQPSAPGLYHTAFLLPDRSDLGAWLDQAIKYQVPLDGASNHRVSEAVYLTDPEGNGIEIYADRPNDEWQRKDGDVDIQSRRLDVDELLARATHWNGMPQGTKIGHVHLQVSSVGSADKVFVDGLGLDIAKKMPGMGFYSVGGYHHHFGANTYHSRGMDRPKGKATGLMRVDLDIQSDADLPAFIDADWGTRFVVNKREAMAA